MTRRHIMSKTNTFEAILAGLTAVRGVQRTAEAIEVAAGKFTKAAAKVAKPAEGTVNTGRFTGLHIMEFQDHLYGKNMTKGWGFTDGELAVAWRAEFPNAKCNFADRHLYVTSARGDLNRDKRGTKLANLRGLYKFEGPVVQFHPKPVEEKAKGKKVKALKAAQPAEAQALVPVVEQATEPVAQ